MKVIRAVLFDMIGTTVLEKDANFINSCFETAFAQNHISIHKSEITNVRGIDKKEAIEQILKNRNHPLALKVEIFETFKNNVVNGISNFEEHKDLENVIKQLQQLKVKIGIASGLPHDIFEALFDKFGWQRFSFDYRNVYEHFERGRPHPAMIYDMCEKLQTDPSNLLKVGDTVADVEEGKNAGAVTAVILVGTQAEMLLRNANADHVISSLRDVPGLLT